MYNALECGTFGRRTEAELPEMRDIGTTTRNVVVSCSKPGGKDTELDILMLATIAFSSCACNRMISGNLVAAIVHN